MCHLIACYSKPGDVVGDMTMFTGISGEAALRMGRRFVGVEKEDAPYGPLQIRPFSRAVERLQRVTYALAHVATASMDVSPLPTAEQSRARTYDNPATVGDGVEVKPSLINGAGMGAFTTEEFDKGAIVTEYAHHGVLNRNDVAQLSVQTHVLTLELQQSYLNGIREAIDGQGVASLANDCFNCIGKPLPDDSGGVFEYNVEIVKSPNPRLLNRAFLRALRPLRRGEELFWKYEGLFAMGGQRLSLRTLDSGETIAELEVRSPPRCKSPPVVHHP